MTTVRNEDLFVVYRSETGVPDQFSSVEVLTQSAFDYSSGESYNFSTSTLNLEIVNGSRLPYTSTGSGLTVDYRISGGEVVEVRVLVGGQGYGENELVSGPSGSEFRVDQNTFGVVTELVIVKEGSGATIGDGFLSAYPVIGGSGEKASVFPVVVGSQVANIVVSSTKFVNNELTNESNQYKTGDTISLQDSSSVDILTADIAYVTRSPASNEPGGTFKLEGAQLYGDVQELIDNSVVDLSVSIADYDDTGNFNGDLSYDVDQGLITFQRGGAVPYVTDDYGYNLNENGVFTSSEVATQAEFNAKVYAKIGFIENNIYNFTGTTDAVPHTSPSLIAGTRTACLSEEAPSATALVADKDYVDRIKNISDANKIDIKNIENLIQSFETGGMLYKGNLDTDNTLPAIEECNVGWFWIAGEDYYEPRLGLPDDDDSVPNVLEESMIAVKDNDGAKEFEIIERTSYDGVYLKVDSPDDIQTVVGHVQFEKASATDLTQTVDDASTLVTKSYVDSYSYPYLPLTGGTLTGDLEIEDKVFTITDVGDPIVELKESGNHFEKPTFFNSRTTHQGITLHAPGFNDATGLEVLHIVPDGYNNKVYYTIPSDKIVDIGHEFSSGIRITNQNPNHTEEPGILLIEGKTLANNAVAKIRMRGAYVHGLPEGSINFYIDETIEIEAIKLKTKATLNLNAGNDLPYLESFVGPGFNQSSVSYKGMIGDPYHITNKEYVDHLYDNALDIIDERTGDLKLADLTDVALVSPVQGQALTFNEDPDGGEGTWGASTALLLNMPQNNTVNVLGTPTWVYTEGNPFFFANSVPDTDTLVVLSSGSVGALVVRSDGAVLVPGADGDGFMATDDTHAVSKKYLDSRLDGFDGLDGYLSKYGETVDDATENVDYKWNKPLTFESNNSIQIKLNDTASILMDIDEDNESQTVIESDILDLKAHGNLAFSADGRTIVNGNEVEIKGTTSLSLVTVRGDVVISAGESDGTPRAERINKEIDKIIHPKQITTKEYVDDKVRPVQIVAGNPSNTKVGDAWFSTNQNVFIIKVA